MAPNITPLVHFRTIGCFRYGRYSVRNVRWNLCFNIKSGIPQFTILRRAATKTNSVPKPTHHYPHNEISIQHPSQTFLQQHHQCLHSYCCTYTTDWRVSSVGIAGMPLLAILLSGNHAGDSTHQTTSPFSGSYACQSNTQEACLGQSIAFTARRARVLELQRQRRTRVSAPFDATTGFRSKGKQACHSIGVPSFTPSYRRNEGCSGAAAYAYIGRLR